MLASLALAPDLFAYILAVKAFRVASGCRTGGEDPPKTPFRLFRMFIMLKLLWQTCLFVFGLFMWHLDAARFITILCERTGIWIRVAFILFVFVPGFAALFIALYWGIIQFSRRARTWTNLDLEFRPNYRTASVRSANQITYRPGIIYSTSILRR